MIEDQHAGGRARTSAHDRPRHPAHGRGVARAGHGGRARVRDSATRSSVCRTTRPAPEPWSCSTRTTGRSSRWRRPRPTTPPSSPTASRPRSSSSSTRPESNFPLVNRAVQGLYAPGSTFKLVTALAGSPDRAARPERRRSTTAGASASATDASAATTRRTARHRQPPARAHGLERRVLLQLGRDMWQYYNAWTKAQSDGSGGAEDEISKGYAIQETAAEYGFGEPTGIGLARRGRRSRARPGVEGGVQPQRARPATEARATRCGSRATTSTSRSARATCSSRRSSSPARTRRSRTAARSTRPGWRRAVLEPGTGRDQPQPVIADARAAAGRARWSSPPERRRAIMDGLLGVDDERRPAPPTPPSAGFGGPTVAGKTGTAEVVGKQDTSLFVGITHAGSAAVRRAGGRRGRRLRRRRSRRRSCAAGHRGAQRQPEPAAGAGATGRRAGTDALMAIAPADAHRAGPAVRRPPIARLGTRRSLFATSILRDLDPLLIGATLAIAALGLLMIYSSTRERLAARGDRRALLRQAPGRRRSCSASP